MTRGKRKPGSTEKTFTTEAQSARRKKNAGLEMFFSVNHPYSLRDLRVSVVKWPFCSGFNLIRLASRRVILYNSNILTRTSRNQKS